MLKKTQHYIDHPEDIKVIKCMSDIQIQDVWDDINVDLFKEWVYFNDAEDGKVMFDIDELEEFVETIIHNTEHNYQVAIEIQKIIKALDLNDATMLLIFDKS
jgi:hypothetical protein